MTVQELIEQLEAFCDKRGKDTSEVLAVVDYGCDYGDIETLDWYDDDGKLSIVVNG